MPISPELKDDILQLRTALAPLPTDWDGKKCIKEMKDRNSRNWKQLEWIGFYGEELVLQHLPGDVFSIPGDSYGNATFDFQGAVNWDIKAHPRTTNGAWLNDKEAMDLSVADYGFAGLVILGLDCMYDEGGDFKAWHDRLKGKRTQYERNRVSRGARSRRRKTHAILRNVDLVLLDSSHLQQLKEVQKNMRNSDGSPRRGKYSITNEQIVEYCQTSISY